MKTLEFILIAAGIVYLLYQFGRYLYKNGKFEANYEPPKHRSPDGYDDPSDVGYWIALGYKDFPR